MTRLGLRCVTAPRRGVQNVSRKAALVATLIALAGLQAAAHAETLACEPGSEPYLEVVFYEREIHSGPFPPPRLHEARGAILICRDRRVLETRIFTETAPARADLPFLATVTRGRAKPFIWSELTTVAALIRIGFMTSCQLHLMPIEGLVDAKVTWYGARGRVNTFRQSSFDETLRTCSLDEQSLWQGLALLELEPGFEQVRFR